MKVSVALSALHLGYQNVVVISFGDSTLSENRDLTFLVKYGTKRMPKLTIQFLVQDATAG